jgi:hypothetical protein
VAASAWAADHRANATTTTTTTTTTTVVQRAAHKGAALGFLFIANTHKHTKFIIFNLFISFAGGLLRNWNER